MNKFAEEIGRLVAGMLKTGIDSIVGTSIPGTRDWRGQQITGGAGVPGGYKPPHDSFAVPGTPVFRSAYPGNMELLRQFREWLPERGRVGTPLQPAPPQGINPFRDVFPDEFTRPAHMKSVPGATYPPPVGTAIGGQI